MISSIADDACFRVAGIPSAPMSPLSGTPFVSLNRNEPVEKK
jgi:hypothetical protein